jgi:hypothetical protein
MEQEENTKLLEVKEPEEKNENGIECFICNGRIKDNDTKIKVYVCIFCQVELKCHKECVTLFLDIKLLSILNDKEVDIANRKGIYLNILKIKGQKNYLSCLSCKKGLDLVSYKPSCFYSCFFKNKPEQEAYLVAHKE